MKKTFRSILTLILCLLALCVFAACGADGVDGKDGTDGKDGIDGVTPTVEVSADGYWVINGIRTGYKAVAEDGANGEDGITPTVEISADGYWVINGEKTEYKAVGADGANGKDGVNGTDGKDGVTPTIEISADGYWVINGEKTEYKAVGADGKDGLNGTDGKDGVTPTIEISADGYWVINGVKTEYRANGDCTSFAHEWSETTETVSCCTLKVTVKTCTLCGTQNVKCENVDAHNYSVSVIAPTCVSQGYTLHSCNDCGHSYTDTYKAATGVHDWQELYVLFENCKEKTTLITCRVCHTVEAEEGEGNLSHNYVDRVCTVCGELQPSEGLEYTLNSKKTSYSVTGIGTCTDNDIVIPSEYNGLPVTSIGSSAFRSCTSLTSVVIGDNVKSIGYEAFSYCSSLTIYCEAQSKPSGWSSSWNDSNRPVVWGYVPED